MSKYKILKIANIIAKLRLEKALTYTNSKSRSNKLDFDKIKMSGKCCLRI
jgi:hypothetical protein